MAERQKIINRLKSLEDIEGVNVKESDGGKTVRVQHKKYHALNFLFRWRRNHFAGYFIDGKGQRSQAVVSLRIGLDAIHFSAAYSLLVEMRAKQRG